MKKWVAELLILALCLGGCGKQTVEEPGPGFSVEGVRVEMSAPADPLLRALGEPVSLTEEPSCAFRGMDRTYYFGHLYLRTYEDGGEERILGAWFADDSLRTDEGISVGSSRESVVKAYGSLQSENLCRIRAGNSILTVILENGTVSSVQYDLAME